jgi:AcrR family transcriptional regulator
MNSPVDPRSDPDRPGPGWNLPRGPHGLPPELVAQNQRERLIAGVAVAVAEHGYGKLTVARVTAAVGVSRTTFYELFANKHEAVLAAHDIACEHFMGLLMRACGGQRKWPLKVRAAIGATVDFAVAQPAQAQLLTLDALSANIEIAQRVLDLSDHLAALLSAGRRHSPHGAELPELTEKALVGAISAILAGRLMNGETEMLVALESQFVELTLIPYLGPEEASRVAAQTI